MRKDERLLRDVGRRIAELRHTRGWTQAHLAERAGVETAQIGVLESGHANMTLRTLSRIASLLGVEPKDLLEPPTSRAPRRRAGRPKRQP